MTQMGQLATIRTALSEAINNNVADVVASTYIPDAVNVPCVIVEPGSPAIDYLQAMNSTNADWEIDLLILASRANVVAGQEIIDELASPDGARSIPALLDTDPTLNGTVGYAVAAAMRDYGRFTIGGVEYIGCRIEIQVNV